MLFFMAGYEVDFARLRGGPLSRALKPSTAAAMVGAGMLPVLLHPFPALKVSGDSRAPQGPEEAAESW